MSQISDSEPDISLTIADVSRDTFRRLLAELPEASQTSVATKLRRTDFANLIEDSIFDYESDIPTNSAANDDRQTTPHAQTDHEDIQMALETLRPLEVSRRGLRKRNFASTHPYLTDMAHWLGIASANYLNDVYEQYHDVLPILRLLNSEYMRKKEKYPSEERYKWKSFYKLIGKSHPQYNLQNEDSAQKNQDGNDSDSHSSDDSSNSGSDSDLNVSRNRTMVIVESDEEKQVDSETSMSEPQSDDDSDSSSSLTSSQVVVRVGGRLRSEKSVLRGVLPESAKRLNLWKAPRPSSRSKLSAREKRKGLAIKKRSSAAKRDTSQLDQFINEGDLYLEVYGAEVPLLPINDDFESLQQRSEVFDQKYNDYYSVSSESDVSLPQPNLVDDTIDTDNDTHITSLYLKHSSHSRIPPTRREERPREQNHEVFFVPEFSSDEAIEARDEIDRQVTVFNRSSSTKQPRSVKPISKRPRQPRKSKPLGIKKARRHPQSFPSVDPQRVAKRKNAKKPHTKHSSKSENSHQSILSNYYFRRDPVMSTVAFEAESNKRFVKPLKHFLNPETSVNAQPIGNEFLEHIPKIHALDHQHPDFGFIDTQIASISDHKYIFTLLNKEQSRKESISFLNKIARICKSSPEKVYVIHDIVQSLKSFIRWQLILQEPIGSLEKEYLDSSLEVFVRHNKSALDPILPFLLLLRYISLKISQRTQILRADDETLARFVSSFWIRCFDTFEDERLLFEDDSFLLVFSIVQSDWGIFWKSMHLSLKRYNGNPVSTLRTLHVISLSIPSTNYDWESFYTLFDSTNVTDSSEFFVGFISVCFSLAQRRSWPLEEKLILKLYSTVTRKRFFNFKDEPNSIVYLGKIHTMSDLPDTTFFDKFVNLLYYYVSSLDNVLSAKRLSLKMMIASQYVHENNSTHRAALANRLNLIILLAQLSEVNQTNSFISLIKLISETQDVDVYYLTVKQLTIFCDIIRARPKQFPIEGFQILINKIAQVYLTLSGATKIWIQMCLCLKKSLLADNVPSPLHQTLLFLEFFNRVKLRDAHDDIGFKLVEMLELSTIPLSLYRTDFLERAPLLNEVIGKLIEFLHYQLGRFPMESSIREKKLVSTVERCISVWCRLTSMYSSPNWNKVLLLDYPYIGNSYLRNMFSLFLLLKILDYTKLSQHLDLVLSSLLKALTSFNTSLYAAPLINSLRANDVSAVDLSRIHLPSHLTTIELNNNKLQIVLAIVSNVCDSNMQESSKNFLISSLVITLNEEYDKHYLSPRFVEFSKKIIEHVEVYCVDQIKDLREEKELARKLGITTFGRQKLKWRALPLIDQLRLLHEEVISSLLHKKDVSDTLNQYLDMNTMANIFHLTSIYMKAIGNNQNQCWLLLSVLLDYVVEKLQVFGIDTSSRDFGKFALLLEDMTLLFIAHWGSRFTHSLQNFQLNALQQSCKIAAEAFFVFDGYKDRAFISDMIEKQAVDWSLPSSGKHIELSRPFSTFKLYDIMTNHKTLSQLDEQLMIPEHEKYDISQSMRELQLLVTPVKKSGLLEFDFNLA